MWTIRRLGSGTVWTRREYNNRFVVLLLHLALIGKKIIAYCKTVAQKSDFTLLTNLLLNLLITD